MLVVAYEDFVLALDREAGRGLVIVLLGAGRGAIGGLAGQHQGVLEETGGHTLDHMDGQRQTPTGYELPS